MNICPHCCNTEHESEIVSPAKDELVDKQCFYCGTVLTDGQIADSAIVAELEGE